MNNTNNDSFELYYGLFLYNRNATEELERLEQVSAGCQQFGLAAVRHFSCGRGPEGVTCV